ARLGLGHGHTLFQHAAPEPGAAVLVAVPLVHRFQGRQRLRDGQFGPFGEHVELGVGDHRGDLEDGVVVGVQTGHFQVDPHQPLVVCHPRSFVVHRDAHGNAAAQAGGRPRLARNQLRRRVPASSPSTPPVTSTRWLWRGSASRSNTLPAAPVLGSAAPNTTRATRACTIAMAHIAQGSRVTYTVHPSRRWLPTTRPASRMATISACALGSCSQILRLKPSPTTRPWASTTTAPTGISLNSRSAR